MRSMPTNTTLLSLRLCVSCTALLVFTFVTNAHSQNKSDWHQAGTSWNKTQGGAPTPGDRYWLSYTEENVERSPEESKILKELFGR